MYGGLARSEKNIQIYQKTYGDNQKWTLQTSGQRVQGIAEDTSYIIASADNTDYALDIYGGKAMAGNGSNIQIYKKHGNENQQFQFVYNEHYNAYEIVYPNKNKSLNAYNRHFHFQLS